MYLSKYSSKGGWSSGDPRASAAHPRIQLLSLHSHQEERNTSCSVSGTSFTGKLIHPSATLDFTTLPLEGAIAASWQVIIGFPQHTRWIRTWTFSLCMLEVFLEVLILLLIQTRSYVQPTSCVVVSFHQCPRLSTLTPSLLDSGNLKWRDCERMWILPRCVAEREESEQPTPWQPCSSWPPVFHQPHLTDLCKVDGVCVCPTYCILETQAGVTAVWTELSQRCGDHLAESGSADWRGGATGDGCEHWDPDWSLWEPQYCVSQYNDSTAIVLRS